MKSDSEFTSIQNPSMKQTQNQRNNYYIKALNHPLIKDSIVYQKGKIDEVVLIPKVRNNTFQVQEIPSSEKELIISRCLIDKEKFLNNPDLKFNEEIMFAKFYKKYEDILNKFTY